MGSDSIGSLYIDVAARTAQLQTDVASIKGIVNGLKSDVAAATQGIGTIGDASTKMGQTIQTAGLSSRATMMLMREAISLVSEEIKSVWTNIQNIPGVPQATVDSVNNMKYSFTQTKQSLDGFVAGILAGLNNAGDTMGNFVARILYGQAAVDRATKEMAAAADQQANGAYYDKVAKLQQQINQALLDCVPDGTTKDLNISVNTPYGAVNIVGANVSKSDTEITAENLDVIISSALSPVVHIHWTGFTPPSGQTQPVTVKLHKPA